MVYTINFNMNCSTNIWLSDVYHCCVFRNNCDYFISLFSRLYCMTRSTNIIYSKTIEFIILINYCGDSQLTTRCNKEQFLISRRRYFSITTRDIIFYVHDDIALWNSTSICRLSIEFYSRPLRNLSTFSSLKNSSIVYYKLSISSNISSCDGICFAFRIIHIKTIDHIMTMIKSRKMYRSISLQPEIFVSIITISCVYKRQSFRLYFSRFCIENIYSIFNMKK